MEMKFMAKLERVYIPKMLVAVKLDNS